MNFEEIANDIKVDIDSYCVKEFSGGFRKHLGASVIGKECPRYLYFHFRWFKHENLNGRLLRLFNRGHLEESRFIRYLEGIGCKVIAADETGSQIKISDCQNHFGGSLDGVGVLPEKYLINEPVLLEFKTSSDKYFKIMVEKGVKACKPEHFIQMSIYGYKKKLNYALYMVVNKNTDELYCEIVKLDYEVAKFNIKKAEVIILAESPPDGISTNFNFYKCKNCSMKTICQKAEMPDKNCRTCIYSKPSFNGNWYCNFYQKDEIPEQIMLNSCENYKCIV